MKQDYINNLFNRFMSAYSRNKEVYFDADEIESLLEYFEENEDYTYYPEVLNLGLKLHPHSTELQIMRGKWYLYNEQYSKALKSVEHITDKDNDDLDMLRLDCYTALNDFPNAFIYINNLFSYKSEYLEDAVINLAEALGDSGYLKTSAKILQKGLELYPQNSEFLEELIYDYESLNLYEKAIQCYQKLIELNPYSISYWFNLGRMYSIIEKYDKAIEAFDFALTCDPTNNEVKILKAYCHYMNENYEIAANYYKQLISDKESENRITPLLAECHIKMENYEDGYQLLKPIFDAEHSQFETSFYIDFARCCIETERDKEAFLVLEEAYSFYPDNLQIISMMAIISHSNGKEDDALDLAFKLFDKIKDINLKKNDTSKLLEIAQTYHKIGDNEKAIEYYKEVLKKNPNTPLIHFYMAIAYLIIGNMQQFKAHLVQIESESGVMQQLNEFGIFKYKKISDIKKRDIFTRKYIKLKSLSDEYLTNKKNKN